MLVPLCGKTVDMIFLAHHGYNVIGVEYSEEAVVSFFTENQIEYEVIDQNSGFKTYKSLTLSIRILNGNFFDVSPDIVGDVDGIWDRGSLIALNPCQRIEYGKVMLGLMNSETVYLLDSLGYDQSKLGGPPFSVPCSVIDNLYSEKCGITLLEEFSSEFCKVRYKLDETLKRKESLYKIVLRT